MTASTQKLLGDIEFIASTYIVFVATHSMLIIGVVNNSVVL